jgi:hypothetical protein
MEIAMEADAPPSPAAAAATAAPAAAAASSEPAPGSEASSCEWETVASSEQLAREDARLPVEVNGRHLALVRHGRAATSRPMTDFP